MLLYFIISNFIINIVFLGIIIYFIVVLNGKYKGQGNGQDTGKGQVTGKGKVTGKGQVTANSKDDVKIVEGKNANSKNNLAISNPKKLKYNQKKCFNCIGENREKRQIKDCPNCGSENYDTGCIPAVVKTGKLNNCVPKELSQEQAYRACIGVSNSINSCNLIHPDHMLEYQKKECKRPDGEYDYYCAYDESDSCSHNKCSLKPGGYFSYGSQSACSCQRVQGEDLPDDIGRECKESNCEDYTPYRKAPGLLVDPQLKRFYDGYATYMDVPTLNSWYSALISDSQII